MFLWEIEQIWLKTQWRGIYVYSMYIPLWHKRRNSPTLRNDLPVIDVGRIGNTFREDESKRNNIGLKIYFVRQFHFWADQLFNKLYVDEESKW